MQSIKKILSSFELLIRCVVVGGLLATISIISAVDICYNTYPTGTPSCLTTPFCDVDCTGLADGNYGFFCNNYYHQCSGQSATLVNCTAGQSFDSFIGECASLIVCNQTILDCFILFDWHIDTNIGYTCKQYFTHCSGVIVIGSFIATPVICEGNSQVFDNVTLSCIEASLAPQCGNVPTACIDPQTPMSPTLVFDANSTLRRPFIRRLPKGVKHASKNRDRHA